MNNFLNNEDIEEIVKEGQIAGVLLLATEMDEADFKAFERLNVPVILLDSYFDKADIDQILINNTKGAYQAVDYLVRNGHKEIYSWYV